MTRPVLLLTTFALILTAVQTPSQEAKKGKRADPGAVELAPDLIQEIDDAKIEELIEELAKAVQIDRDGQKLLKYEAYLQAIITEKSRYIIQVSASEQVQKAYELISREDVYARLHELNGLDKEEDRGRAYAAFLKEHGLDQKTMRYAVALAQTQQVLERSNELLSRTRDLKDQRLRDREESSAALPDLSEQEGVSKTLSKIEAGLATIDGKQAAGNPEGLDPYRTDAEALKFFARPKRPE